MQNVTQTHSQLTFAASNRTERDATINAAVIALRVTAMTARSGILVTRKSPHLFTVAVSQSVPFGLTREVDEAPLLLNPPKPAPTSTVWTLLFERRRRCGLELDLGHHDRLLERQNTGLFPDEINERILAVALSYKNSHEDTEVVLLSIGPAAAERRQRLAARAHYGLPSHLVAFGGRTISA